METLSAEYGWTPEEIMRQDFNVINQYIEIINLKRQLELARSKKYGGK
ncbi:MAG: hypothetical protein NTZ18_03630 [Candidatus Komeilibacteria bacterium]|nr:hypothetical protein [Candidatus Komeilibacteria bacterium]